MASTKHSALHGQNPQAQASQVLAPDLPLDWSGQVREAVRRDKLIPHYQPIVNIATGDIVGVEALARWIHPSDGAIGPDRFIRTAETGGFIGDLFFQILRRVCIDARRWVGLKVAVNVSPQQFHDPFLASKILSVLRGTGFPANRLEIEVTEGMPLLDWARTANTLRHLKAEGVRFALDDFGTGYANLSHLRELPFDCLKIDRSFVSAVPGRPENCKIIRSIVTLAADFGLTTVAEGIETEAQLDWLRDAGCDLAQGHYFFYPQPASEIDALL